MKRVVLKIYGHVQGVYFRAEAQRKALALGLFGLVHNLPDDTVEIIAEGEEPDLNELIKWAQRGPEMAQVGKVKVNWVNPTGNLTTFQIE